MHLLHKRNRVLEPAAAGVALLFLWVFGLATHGAVAATPAQGSTIPTAASNSDFAIADFDGDRKPDLATVDLERFDSLNARYSIRFHLTAGGGQSIGVAAPFGGLHIAARDVNGDDALDLIISTAWLHQPVAILLNDGHGQFTLASPAAFSVTVWESSTGWEPKTNQVHENSAIFRLGSSSGAFKRWDGVSLPQQLPEQLSLRHSHVPTSPDQISHFGRAPPTIRFHA